MQHFSTFFRRKEAVAIGFVFFLQSMVFAAWLVHIPEVKSRLALSEGDLGALLFGLPVGLLLMNPLSGLLVRRFGAVQVTLYALVGMLASIWLPVLAPSASHLFVGLFVLGLFAALVNVAMNTCAALVEEQFSVRIISTCHGLWSCGNLLCSSVLAVAIAFALPIVYRLCFLSLLVLGGLCFLKNTLVNIVETQEEGVRKSAFVLPNLKLLALIFIGISVTMGEGLAFDWSGVYMKEVAGAPASLATFGLSAFAALMALVRLFGDWLLEKYKGMVLLVLGGFTGALGVLLCVFFPQPGLCFLGLMLLGGGVALGSPILYAASMRIEGVAPSAGLATFASLSFFGFLAAPPLIGFLGEHFGLPTAFACIAFVLALGAVMAWTHSK